MDLSSRVPSIPGLAKALGVTRQHLWAILTGGCQAGPKLAIAIEKATTSAITRSELRPDLWPQPGTSSDPAA